MVRSLQRARRLERFVCLMEMPMTRAKAYYLQESRSVGMRGGQRYLNIGELCVRYRRSSSTVMRWSNDPTIDFPLPEQMTPGGHNFWREQLLDEADRRRQEAAHRRRRSAPGRMRPVGQCRDLARPRR